MESKEDKFKSLLKKIFQYDKDKIDLDFGVYRVFKHKEDEIQNFISKELPSFIEENIKELEVSTIYNHTLEFFERYFQDGDFYPIPIYSTSKNHILRHNGEEVIFSWANKDQYYIKSIDNFSIYKIKNDDLYDDKFAETNTNAVNFVVDDIDDTKGNNKTNRIFTLSSKDVEFVEDEGFNIYLDYKNSSSDLEEIDEDKLFDIIQSAKINLTYDEITHHLKKFKNLRKTDFFIHKHLEKFLNEELDYYLKTKVLKDISTLSDIDIKVTQVVKNVCEYIIKFISSLEELQKILWEKKKFAYDVNYIVTLDKLNIELLKEIIKNKDFKTQIDEWKDLGLIDTFDTKDYIDGLLNELKDKYKYLPLDTKYFTEDIKYKILETFDNLDEQIDGILINSDNFHGLNYLQNRFRNKIKCVYIDPPYNTGSDGFAYKDNYKHSSWLSMMYDRFLLVEKLLNNNGALLSSINDNESMYLEQILKNSFPNFDYQTKIALKVRHEDRILRNDIPYQEIMEDIHFVGKSNFIQGRLPDKDADKKLLDYTHQIILKNEPKSIEQIGKYMVEIYTKDDYELIKSKPDTRNFKRYTIRGSLITQKGSASEYYEMFLRDRKISDGNETLYKVMKLGEKGDGLGYRYIMQPTKNGGKNGIYFQGFPLNTNSIGKPYPNFYNFEQDFNNIANEGGISFPNGKKPISLLNLLFNISNITPNSIILDYFAGSGTTGHAIINLNRGKKEKRKYLLMETNEYFNSILKPRIKKVICSDNWKDGKAQDSKGISQLIKYYKLEQYEDTLENSHLHTNTDDYKKDIEPLKEYMSELYTSKYLSLYKDFIAKESKSLMLDNSIFNDPFNFSLKVNIDSVIKNKKMDLVETFNTLKGLEVNNIKVRFFNNKKYIFIDAKNEVVIWREFDKTLDIQKELEFIKENCDIDKQLYINGITQTHTKKELVAKELVFELRSLLIEGVRLDD